MPQIVKVPVDNSPEPPVLTAPHEYVYELKPGDSPDKVLKYTESTIDELEQGYGACHEALSAYRK